MYIYIGLTPLAVAAYIPASGRPNRYRQKIRYPSSCIYLSISISIYLYRSHLRAVARTGIDNESVIPAVLPNSVDVLLGVAKDDIYIYI